MGAARTRRVASATGSDGTIGTLTTPATTARPVPLELVATAPRTPELREYERPSVGPGEVRPESEFSAFKHATGLGGYRGETRDFTAPFDWELRLHRSGESARPEFPVALGNVTVGTVAAVGEDVDGFEPGDRAYGHLPVRETHVVPE